MADKIFYSIPFRAQEIVKGKKLEKCDLALSVRQNLRLLLMTPPLRVRHNPLYQCKIHWQQFSVENGVMEEDERIEDNFKLSLEKNVQRLINEFEPRIQLNELNIDVKYPTEEDQAVLALGAARGPDLRKTIQVVVSLKAAVKPEYTFDGQTLLLEDTIPLF